MKFVPFQTKVPGWDYHESLHLALLALCLQTQHALRRHQHLELRLPQKLVQGVSKQAFETILFDALSCEFPELNQRLKLIVGPYESCNVRPREEGNKK
jgi:hypothetical protein